MQPKQIENTSSKTEQINDASTLQLNQHEIPEWIQSLTGILKGKAPNDIDLWDAKYEYLKEKYNL